MNQHNEYYKRKTDFFLLIKGGCMRKKILLFFCLGFILPTVVSCSNMKQATTVKELSYDYNKKSNNLIYVLENDSYIPFIVLTNNYNGQTLLLRYNILNEQMRISDYYSSYEGCEIDEFLNSTYMNRLSSIKDSIVESSILITDEASLGLSGSTTKSISRHVFLLSLNEIDAKGLSNEGTAIEYFKDENNRLAYSDDNVLISWWLRTPDTWGSSITYTMGENNKIGSTNSSDPNGVRPAFCVSPSLAIEASDDIIPDEIVYIFSKEN